MLSCTCLITLSKLGVFTTLLGVSSGELLLVGKSSFRLNYTRRSGFTTSNILVGRFLLGTLPEINVFF
jgi:hypothetical protein